MSPSCGTGFPACAPAGRWLRGQAGKPVPHGSLSHTRDIQDKILANNQKLVHLSGKAATGETLTDPDFLIAANAIRLRRKVEMYQWQEKSESKTEKKLGGGTETKTTYSYTRAWADHPIDSSSFKEAGDHKNPSEMRYQSRDAQAEHVTLGAFTLTPSLIGMMDRYEPVAVTEQSLAALPDAMKSALKVHESSFYAGGDPANPQIGDTRIAFSAVLPSDVSVVSKQNGTSFEPYRASTGMEIEMLKTGVFTAQSMFESALKQNTVLTWILRAVGFFLMFFGLLLFFRPISVLGDVVPFVGSLMAFGTGLFAFVISIVLSTTTIAVAWIVYRPLLGIGLLAVAIAVLVWLAVSGKKRVAAAAQPVAATT